LHAEGPLLTTPAQRWRRAGEILDVLLTDVIAAMR